MTLKMFLNWATSSGVLTAQEAQAEFARLEATPNWPSKKMGTIANPQIGYLIHMFDEVEGFKEQSHSIEVCESSKRAGISSNAEDHAARLQALDYDHQHVSQFAGPAGFLAKQTDHGLNMLRNDEDTFNFGGNAGTVEKGSSKLPAFSTLMPVNVLGTGGSPQSSVPPSPSNPAVISPGDHPITPQKRIDGQDAPTPPGEGDTKRRKKATMEEVHKLDAVSAHCTGKLQDSWTDYREWETKASPSLQEFEKVRDAITELEGLQEHEGDIMNSVVAERTEVQKKYHWLKYCIRAIQLGMQGKPFVIEGGATVQSMQQATSTAFTELAKEFEDDGLVLAAGVQHDRRLHLNLCYMQGKEAMLTASSWDELENAKKECMNNVKAIKSFTTTLGKDHGNFVKRITALEGKIKLLKQISKISGAGVGEGQAQPRKAPPGRKKANEPAIFGVNHPFEGLISFKEYVSSETDPAADRADPAQPFIIRNIPEWVAICKGDELVMQAVAHLQNVLATPSTNRSTTLKRASISVPQEKVSQLYTALQDHKLIPKVIALHGVEQPELRGVMHNVVVWGNANDSKYIGTEKGEIGVLKFGLAGDRVVGCMHVSAALDWYAQMRGKSAEEVRGEGMPTAEELFDFMKAQDKT